MRVERGGTLPPEIFSSKKVKNCLQPFEINILPRKLIKLSKKDASPGANMAFRAILAPGEEFRDIFFYLI